MSGYAKLALIAALLVIGFGTGWTVQGWRKEGQIQALTAAHQRLVAESWRAGFERNKKLQADRDALALSLVGIGTVAANQKRKDDAEIDRLNARLRDGTLRLRVPVVCPAPAAGLPGSTAGRSVDSGAGAELDPAARPDYLALRSALKDAERQINACGESLARITRQPRPQLAPEAP